MEVTADRCEITLTRSTRAKNAPMREFSACYTGTNTPVEGMNGSNAGEMLTGVSRDVFRRSAFIGQGAVAVTGSPELEKRISAIVSTGEEHSSYSEADERLRAWQRKRRFNRRGMLPELEARMDDAQRRLSDMSGSVEDIRLMEEKLEQTRQSCAELEKAVTESRKKQRRDALERLHAGRSELKRRSEEHERKRSAARCCPPYSALYWRCCWRPYIQALSVCLSSFWPRFSVPGPWSCCCTMRRSAGPLWKPRGSGGRF